MTRVSKSDGLLQLPATLDQPTTWAKVYNIYADTLLGTGLIPSKVCIISSDCFLKDGYLAKQVYDAQTSFYQSQSCMLTTDVSPMVLMCNIAI